MDCEGVSVMSSREYSDQSANPPIQALSEQMSLLACHLTSGRSVVPVAKKTRRGKRGSKNRKKVGDDCALPTETGLGDKKEVPSDMINVENEEFPLLDLKEPPSNPELHVSREPRTKPTTSRNLRANNALPLTSSSANRAGPELKLLGKATSDKLTSPGLSSLQPKPDLLSTKPNVPSSKAKSDPRTSRSSNDRVVNVNDRLDGKKKNVAQVAKSCKKPPKLICDPIVAHEDVAVQEWADFRTGVLVVSQKSPDQAYVRVAGQENDDINIGGIAQRSRAFNGDFVIAKILPRWEWKVRPECIEEVQAALGIKELRGCSSKKAIQSLVQTNLNGNKTHSTGARVSESCNGQSAKECNKQGKKWMDILKESIGLEKIPDRWLQKTGEVVAIRDDGARQLVGIIKRSSAKASNCSEVSFILESSDQRMPNVFIRNLDIPIEISRQQLSRKDLKNRLFLAEITAWPDNQDIPSGRILKMVGPVGDVSSHTAALLIENRISDNPFTENLDDIIESFNDKDPSKEPGRYDFRQDCVFTIDPPDARDLDDAVSCVDLGNGIYKIGVHIADVSFFITEDSPLDLYARERGTSVYMVNQVVPMLPTKMIEHCCSLDPDKERRTVSVMFTMTDHGELLDFHITRGLIRSCVKLSYQTAQDIIDDPGRVTAHSLGVSVPVADSVRRTVVTLYHLTQALRRARFIRGGLRIDQPEFHYELDEKGLPVGMTERLHLPSCQLIEELALLTNMISAKAIYNSYPEIALLRRHPPPQQGLLSGMQKLCHQENMPMYIDSARHIQASMNALCAARPDLLPVLSYLAAKPMKLAEYVCTGLENDTWHYALDVEQYTHMTSPIRRYPDIIVHRLLLATRGYTAAPDVTVPEMKEIVDQCNARKLAAGRCQEASLNLYMGLFVQGFGPLVESGVVVAVYGASLSVDILVPRLAFVQRIFCAKVPGVKSVSHRVRGDRHLLEVTWSPPGKLLHELSTWSCVIVVLSVGNVDVRNIKMTLHRPQ